MKSCPFCAEQIQDQAVVCKHCGRNLGDVAQVAPTTAPPGAPAAVPPLEPPHTNGMAIASLILGLFSLAGIGSILAIVLGSKAKREIDDSNGTQSGRGMAVAGIVLGWLWIGFIVVGLLVAIALPTFLGARDRANDKAAQSGVRNATAAAKTLFTDTDDYSGITPENMTAIEPSLSYTTGQSSGPSDISLSTPSYPYTEIGIAALSESGTCFLLHDDATSGTYFGVGSTSDCTGEAAVSAVGSGW